MVTSGSPLRFPGPAEINVVFVPRVEFGGIDELGTFIVQGSDAESAIDFTTGISMWRNTPPLERVSAKFSAGDVTCELSGNDLSVRFACTSALRLTEMLAAVYHGYVLLLSSALPTPPTVSRISGRVGSAEFTWGIVRSSGSLSVTSKGFIEEAARLAWDRLGRISLPRDARLVAALHYFRQGRRLLVAGETAWEFMAEAMLNFAKCLQALFGATRDEVRSGLRQLNYDEYAIETRLIPVMILRDQFDVGHISLSRRDATEMEVLQWFADRADAAFCDLIRRVLEETDRNTWRPHAHTDTPLDTDEQRTLDRLRRVLAEDRSASPNAS